MAALTLDYYPAQLAYWYGTQGRYRLMPKGRRVGFTHSAANYIIETALEGNAKPLLWVDTVYTNIDRYVERYFLPSLSKLPRHMWDWRAQKKELRICGQLLDLRSADRPDNIEGFGYKDIIVNEAGIVLKGDKGRSLWYNTLLPMTMDFEDCVIRAGGTPKGKKDKAGKAALYYELCCKAERMEPGFDLVRVQTDGNPFLNEAAVQDVKNDLPEGQVRDQEFYGRFVEGGAGVICTEFFTIDDSPIDYVRRCRAWDMAVTVKTSADFSAGALLGIDEPGHVQVQDLRRVKMLWPELKDLICNVSLHDGPDVPVVLEEAGQQGGLIDDLQRDKRMQTREVVGIKPEGDKLTRAMPWVSRAVRGLVSFRSAPWNEPFMDECSAFTVDDTHAHDDQIDAVSLGWSYLLEDHGFQIRDI